MIVIRLSAFFALLCFTLTQPHASEMTGNYQLLICKSPCSFEQPQSAVAEGVLVLSDEPLSPGDIQKLGPSHFSASNEPRACFAGSRSDSAETFAFLGKRGVTSWALENGLIKLELFRSADAGYEIELERIGEVLIGKGVSWGAGVAAPQYSHDFVIGRRIGPVNISVCLEPAG
jgi:hypothetical protein